MGVGWWGGGGGGGGGGGAKTNVWHSSIPAFKGGGGRKVIYRTIRSRFYLGKRGKLFAEERAFT